MFSPASISTSAGCWWRQALPWSGPVATAGLLSASAPDQHLLNDSSLIHGWLINVAAFQPNSTTTKRHKVAWCHAWALLPPSNISSETLSHILGCNFELDATTHIYKKANLEQTQSSSSAWALFWNGLKFAFFHTLVPLINFSTLYHVQNTPRLLCNTSPSNIRQTGLPQNTCHRG